MLRIIHTADFHVDDKNIEEARKCLSFLVKTVKTENNKEDIARYGEAIQQANWAIERILQIVKEGK